MFDQARDFKALEYKGVPRSVHGGMPAANTAYLPVPALFLWDRDMYDSRHTMQATFSFMFCRLEMQLSARLAAIDGMAGKAGGWGKAKLRIDAHRHVSNLGDSQLTLSLAHDST